MEHHPNQGGGARGRILLLFGNYKPELGGDSNAEFDDLSG